MRMRLPTAFLSAAVLALTGLLIPGAIRPAAAMTFRTVSVGSESQCGDDCPTVIEAFGQITEGTPSEFQSFLQENAGTRNLHPVVLLNSPGGRVLASMEFGTLLRSIGATAVVQGQCFSACVYALMGARKRVVPSASQVGIHRMFLYEQDVDRSGDSYIRRRYDNGTMGSVLKRYTSEMGVSPALISAAEHIPSDGLKILSQSEIRRYHLGVPHL